MEQLRSALNDARSRSENQVEKAELEQSQLALAEVRSDLEKTKNYSRDLEQTYQQAQAELEQLTESSAQLRRENVMLIEQFVSMVRPEQYEETTKRNKARLDQLREDEQQRTNELGRLREIIRSAWTCELEPRDFNFLGGDLPVAHIHLAQPRVPNEDLRRVSFWTPDMTDFFNGVPLRMGVVLLTNSEGVMRSGYDWTLAWLSWMIRNVPSLTTEETILRIAISKSLDIARLANSPLIAAMVVTLTSSLSQCLDGSKPDRSTYIRRVKENLNRATIDTSHGLVAVCLWQLDHQSPQTRSIVEAVHSQFRDNLHMVKGQHFAIIWSASDMFLFLDEHRPDKNEVLHHFSKSVERIEHESGKTWHDSAWTIYAPFSIPYRRGRDADFDRFVDEKLPQILQQFLWQHEQDSERYLKALRNDDAKKLLEEWQEEERLKGWH